MEARAMENLDYYFNSDNRSVYQRMESSYLKSINVNQSYWTESQIDTRTKIGDQTLWNDYYGNLPIYKNKHFFFNRVKRVCSMITGHQRKNRKSTIVVPVEADDEKASSQNSKLLFHTMKGADFDEIHSDCFDKGTVTTGLAFSYLWMDYSKDPICGDPRLDCVSATSMLVDPQFRKKDCSDANFLWYRRMLSPQALKAIIPVDMHEYLEHISKSGARDGKFNQMAEAYNYSLTELLSYDEYWYKDFRDATFLIDPQAGLSREWTGSKEEMRDFLSYFPHVRVKKYQVPTVKLAISVQGKPIYDGPNPLKIDRYPFTPYLGYYEPDIPDYAWRVSGVVRNLRDSQFLYNRRKITELDILESQVNSGMKYKPSSLVDPEDAYKKGQGKGIAMRLEADMNDVQEIQPPSIPPSMMQMSEMLGREIMEISGVNEELLGSANDDKAGVLAMLRQSAGVTTLQGLFDNADFAQKNTGEIMLEVIQKNFTKGKIQRILNEEPIPEFEHKAFLNYDIRVEEGVNTTTQRQVAFAQMLQLHEMGIPIPPEFLLAEATVQNKDKLIEAIQQQQQQQQQAEQMKQQVEMALVQAQMKDLEAKSIANQGLGVERLSRVEENRLLAEERRTQAIENIEEAKLAKMKMLRELEDMDLNKIQRLLQIANEIKINQDVEGVEGVQEVADSATQVSPIR